MKRLLEWIIHQVARMGAKLAAKVIERELERDPALLENDPYRLAYVCKGILQRDYGWGPESYMRYRVYVRNGFPCLVIHNTYINKTYLVRAFA